MKHRMVPLACQTGQTPINKQFKLTSAVIGTVNTYELDRYDNAGHLVASNQGDGVMHLMQNDLEGRVTSSTRIGNNGALVDKTVYDLAGNVQSTTTSFGSTITQMVDRWGNVISRSDPRNAGWTTFFSYNANNRLIKTVAPVVDTGTGAVIDQITTATAYDVAGRDVLSVDGNGYGNTKTWDSNDQLAQEKHADGGTVTHTYNLFGNQILLKVDLDANHYRLTGFTYDKLGQLASTVRAKTDDTHTGVRVFTTHASAGDGSNVILDDLGLHQLVEKYAYDELGRRIQTTTTTDASNPLVPDESTSTQYDLEGNIIRTRDLTGADTWRAWDDFHHKITEIDANGNARNWTYSVTGRMLTSTSLAAQYDTPVTTTYTYDDAGLLRSQTSNNPVAALAQNLTYDTYQGTVLRGMLDHSTGQSTLYEYDAAGNRTHEQTINRDHFTLQDNHLVFNAQNQIVSIQNDIADTTGPNSGAHFALHYDYDHNGNRIHAVTDYLDNKGQSHHADTFNTYDTQNRALIVNSLTAGDITYDVAANNTHQLTYNWAGERTSDTYLGKHLEASPQPENLPDTPAPGPFDKIRVSDDTLGTTTETYRYDEAGRLTDTFRDEQVSIDANESLRVRVDTHSYDLAGRVVLNGPSQDSSLFLNGLGVNSLARFSIYEHGRRIREKAKDVADGLKELDDTYFDGASYDRVGNVLKYTVVSHGRGKTIYTTDFNKLDTYVEGTSTATGINGDGNYVSSATTTSTYDANGNRVSVTDNKYDGTTGIRTLQYDAQGHVLAKYQDGKLTRSLIVNGELLGSTDPDSVGDLANPYSAVTGSAIDNSPGYYTVQNEGETWQSIAKAAWGDSKLWYQIADANGGVAGLHPGQIIKLPAKPSTIDNDAHTFKPYDASKLVGSTTANVPTPAGAAPCGGAGQIIVTVVAIVVAAVVTALTRDPEAGVTVYSAIAGAAAGNIAGQVVGNLIGVQSGFNFKSFALSIVSAAVSPGGIPEGQSLWTTAANAAIANATTQAIGVITHLQKSFDWRGVVASGVGAGIGQEVGEALNSNKAFADLGKTGGQFARGFATSFVAGTATALAHGGKVSVVQVATDAFGNTLGESLASALRPAKSQFAGLKFGNYGQTTTDSSTSPWSLSAGGTARFSGYIDNTPVSNDGNNAASVDLGGTFQGYSRSELRDYGFGNAPSSIRFIVGPGGDRFDVGTSGEDDVYTKAYKMVIGKKNNEIIDIAESKGNNLSPTIENAGRLGLFIGDGSPNRYFTPPESLNAVNNYMGDGTQNPFSITLDSGVTLSLNNGAWPPAPATDTPPATLPDTHQNSLSQTPTGVNVPTPPAGKQPGEYVLQFFDWSRSGALNSATATYDANQRSGYMRDIKTNAAAAVSKIRALGPENMQAVEAIARDASAFRDLTRTATQNTLTPWGKAMSLRIEGNKNTVFEDRMADRTKKLTRQLGRAPTTFEVMEGVAAGSGSSNKWVSRIAAGYRIAGPVMAVGQSAMVLNHVYNAAPEDRLRVGATEGGKLAANLLYGAIGATAGVALAGLFLASPVGVGFAAYAGITYLGASFAGSVVGGIVGGQVADQLTTVNYGSFWGH